MRDDDKAQACEAGGKRGEQEFSHQPSRSFIRSIPLVSLVGPAICQTASAQHAENLRTTADLRRWRATRLARPELTCVAKTPARLSPRQHGALTIGPVYRCTVITIPCVDRDAAVEPVCIRVGTDEKEEMMQRTRMRGPVSGRGNAPVSPTAASPSRPTISVPCAIQHSEARDAIDEIARHGASSLGPHHEMQCFTFGARTPRLAS